MAALEYDVVIPTLGRRGYLADAIASVTGQGLEPARVLVVVDGDPEAAVAVRRAHPDVEVLEHPRPRGTAAARATGIAAGTSDWVAFCDDDDLWSPRKQQRFAEAVAQHPDWSALRAPFWYFADTEDGPRGGFGLRRELVGPDLAGLERAAAAAEPLNDLGYLDIAGRSLELMLERNRGAISTTMVRRDVLHGVPPVPDDQRPGEDYLLFVHVAAVTEWQLVPERLAFCRLHHGQDTRRFARSAAGIITARSRAWAAYGDVAPRSLESYGPEYRAELRGFVWGLLRTGQPAEAGRVFRAGSRLLPRRRDRLAVAAPPPLAARWHRLRRDRPAAAPPGAAE